MAFSSAGVQTGTDLSLNNTSNVSGYQSVVLGLGSTAVTGHLVNSVDIDIQGDLTINPEAEFLQCRTIRVRSGATLRINGRIETNGLFTRYSDKLAIMTLLSSGNCCGDFGLILDAGATIIHDGGVIVVNSAISTGGVYQHAGAIVEQAKNSDNQWRHQGTDFQLLSNIPKGQAGLTFIGNDITFLSTDVPERYTPQGVRSAFGFSGSTPNIDIDVPEPNYSDLSSSKHIGLWSGARPIINNGTYEVIKVGAHILGNGSSYGVTIVLVDVTINPKNLEGNTVLAQIYRNATVKGKIANYNNEGHFVDGTSTIIVNTESTNTFSYRSRINAVTTGNSDDVNTGNYAWGYYGDEDTVQGSLLHTFQIRSYGLTATTITVKEGEGAIFEEPTMLPNNNVVSTLAIATTNLASLTIDNSAKTIEVTSSLSTQEIYDSLDLYMSQELQQELDYFFEISGVSLKLLNGWEITSSSIDNVNGAISDSNGDSNITAIVPTGYENDIDVYLSKQNAENETGQIATGSSFRYNSSSLGGTTVWFRMTQIDGSFIIENYDVPVGVGNYEVSLVVTSENAALGAIKTVTDKLDLVLESVDIADRLKRIDGNTQNI